MTGVDDEELRAMLALAAVGALDDAERAELDAALADRPDLQEERRELEAAAATLAFATAMEPPPALRDRVLDAVSQLPRPHVDRVAPAETEGPVAGGHDVAGVVPIERARRRWVAPLSAAAAVVTLVAGAVVVSTQRGDDDVDVASVVEDDAAVTIALEGRISTMHLVHSPRHEAVALVGEDVPVPDGDQVYELWLIEDGRSQRIDIFRPHDDGTVEVLIPEMTPPDGAAFAVTIEPAGGTDAPTGEVVAAST